MYFNLVTCSCFPSELLSLTKTSTPLDIILVAKFFNFLSSSAPLLISISLPGLHGVLSNTMAFVLNAEIEIKFYTCC